VCHLLNNVFFTKARTMRMDGLTTPNWNCSRDPVKPGTYTWRALWHKELGLRYAAGPATPATRRGNNGRPELGRRRRQPDCCATAKQNVARLDRSTEAGRALVVTDLDGQVLWKHNRGGISGIKGAALIGRRLRPRHHRRLDLQTRGRQRRLP